MTRRFSASACAQLMSCPGSANLELAIPGFVHPVRDETAGAKGIGTDIHTLLEIPFEWDVEPRTWLADAVREYAELHWRKRRAIAEDEQELSHWLCKTIITLGSAVHAKRRRQFIEWFQLAHARLLPPLMLKFIADALDFVTEIRAQSSGAQRGWSELQMTATWLPTASGTTADVVIYDYRAGVLYVIDYKTGKLEVEAVENDQLLYYTKSAMVHLNLTEIHEVHMVILQPRYAPKEWIVDPSYVEAWSQRAVAADKRIVAGDLRLVPNDHCTFCPANPHSRGDKGNIMCPAMMEVLYPPVVDEESLFEL